MRQLFNELDGQGNLVREAIKLTPFMVLPDGHEWVPYVPDMAALRARKKEQIEGWRDAQCVASVTTTVGGTSYLWQADKRSQELVNSALNLASAGAAPCPPIWRTEDNIDVPIVLDDLKAIAGAMAYQTQLAYVRSWQLKQAADAAQDAAALDLVAW